jgi:HrpA-like RNA helicase
VRGNLKKLLSALKGEGEVLASCSDDMGCLQRCLVAGYFSNAAQLGNDGLYRTIRGGSRVEVHHSSVYSRFGRLPEWVIFHELVHHKSAQIRDITKVEPRWLLEIAPHYYTTL